MSDSSWQFGRAIGGLGLGLVLAWAAPSWADDPTDAPKEPPAQAADEPAKPQDFATIHAEWQDLEKRMDEVVKKFRQAPADEREELRGEFAGMVNKAKLIVPRLRRAALADFVAKPNGNPEVVRVLVGILANDVRGDEYAQALQLAQTLLEKRAEEDAILSLAGVAAFGANDFELAEKYLNAAKIKSVLDPQAEMIMEQLAEIQASWTKEQAIRDAEKAADDLPRVKLVTNRGTIVIELYENEAPKAVANFISLVEKKYYDGLTFHRVLSNFMAQGGCPKGNGSGGPGYYIPCECGQENYRHHFAGTLSMAHAGPNTGGSQFFLTFRPTPHLDRRHTAFGRVIEGMDVLPKLERRDPQRGGGGEPDRIVKAEVIRKRDHEYVPTKLPEKSK